MLPVGNVELLDKLPSQAKNKYRKINIRSRIYTTGINITAYIKKCENVLAFGLYNVKVDEYCR
jgi:hypothetical protein